MNENKDSTWQNEWGQDHVILRGKLLEKFLEGNMHALKINISN